MIIASIHGIFIKFITKFKQNKFFFSSILVSLFFEECAYQVEFNLQQKDQDILQKNEKEFLQAGFKGKKGQSDEKGSEYEVLG